MINSLNIHHDLWFQGHYDEEKAKGNNDQLFSKRGKMKRKQKVPVVKPPKDDYFEY